MNTDRPTITDPDAHRRFAELAESMGHRMYDKFVGGYVDYEWSKGRHLFMGLPNGVDKQQVLEFGCHIGASSVVLASLGAHVTGIDVAEADLQLARLNAERYGVQNEIEFLHVPDTRSLPFAHQRFDVVSCNSVLEYVDPQHLESVLHEIDRVMAPGGVLMVLGTSNRFWPRDVHSKRWLVNYLPDKLRVGRARSVSPLRVKRCLPAYRDLSLLDEGRLLLQAKEQAGLSTSKRQVASWVQKALQPLGLSVGMLAHSFTLLLQKPA